MILALGLPERRSHPGPGKSHRGAVLSVDCVARAAVDSACVSIVVARFPFALSSAQPRQRSFLTHSEYIAVLFSKTQEYALQAVILLATTPEMFRLNRDVAAQLDVPGPYLAKVLKRFARLGFLESAKGRGGGYRVSPRTLQSSVRDVMAAVDGNDPFSGCAMGMSRCTEQSACPLHDKWAPMRDRMERLFGNVTIAELATKARSGPTRLGRARRTRRSRVAKQ
jgi:Rrf2 family transcriptional regulator, iron-sulfur cluster assembly transcription factor